MKSFIVFLLIVAYAAAIPDRTLKDSFNYKKCEAWLNEDKHRNSVNVVTQVNNGKNEKGGKPSCDNCEQNSNVVENMKAERCSTAAGCSGGYCWAYCGSPDYSKSSGQWCYTTKLASLSASYVKCTEDSQCNTCWNCAGSCGV